MKTSLVITVFNEEKTIKRLLNSLSQQTEKPDEIIFVDGGSTDKTVQLIKEFKLLKPRLRIVVAKGTTIAQGRNRGIKEAKGEIIAMTDAGCWVHPDWFEKITEPFKKKKVEIVAGFYRMTGDSIFQECLTGYLGILPERLDPQNFMPSFRSVGLKKAVWREVGGFNEKLERCGEDTLFNHQAKKLGTKFITVKKALVDWEMPKTWREAIKKFYYYAKGDGQAGIWWHPGQRFSTHNLKISAIYGRYLLGIVFFILGFLNLFFWLFLALLIVFYLIWAINKNFKYLKKWQAIVLLPIIQIVSDWAVMAGFLLGSLNQVNES